MGNWEYMMDLVKFAGDFEEDEPAGNRDEDDGHNDEPYTIDQLARRQYIDRQIRNIRTGKPGTEKI